MNENLVFIAPTAEDRILIAGKIKDFAFKAECENNGSCPDWDCGDCDCQGCDDCGNDCGVCGDCH